MSNLGSANICKLGRASSSTLVLILSLIIPVAGQAQTQTRQTNVTAEEEKLERDFTDPLTTLPQVIIRDSYTPANYGIDGQTNQVIIRPLIPRIPPKTLLPLVQLVRPTFELITVPSRQGGTRTEFGDLPMFDAAILPWPDRKKTGLLIGIGPSFVFPTATSSSAGQGACAVHPESSGTNADDRLPPASLGRV